MKSSLSWIMASVMPPLLALGVGCAGSGTDMPPPAADMATPQGDAPMIAFISPQTGPLAGGIDVLISGSQFDVNQSAVRVTIGGQTAVIKSVTSTQIVVTLPAGAVGSVDVVVQNGNGLSATLAA